MYKPCNARELKQLSFFSPSSTEQTTPVPLTFLFSYIFETTTSSNCLFHLASACNGRYKNKLTNERSTKNILLLFITKKGLLSGECQQDELGGYYRAISPYIVQRF